MTLPTLSLKVRLWCVLVLVLLALGITYWFLKPVPPKAATVTAIAAAAENLKEVKWEAVQTKTAVKSMVVRQVRVKQLAQEIIADTTPGPVLADGAPTILLSDEAVPLELAQLSLQQGEDLQVADASLDKLNASLAQQEALNKVVADRLIQADRSRFTFKKGCFVVGISIAATLEAIHLLRKR